MRSIGLYTCTTCSLNKKGESRSTHGFQRESLQQMPKLNIC